MSYITPANQNTVSQLVLRRIWNIPAEYKELISFEKTYLINLSTFLDTIHPEKYPETYGDLLKQNGYTYFCCYIGTSAQFLDDLEKESSDEFILYRLRGVKKMNIYTCLVKRWEREWSFSSLNRSNTVDLTEEKVLSSSSFSYSNSNI